MADWGLEDWARVISGGFVAMACALSSHQIRQHLLHSRQRALRNYTVRILLMVPVYAVESWLALFLVSGSETAQEWAIVPKILRESFEAFVLFSFMQLTTSYLGGPVALARMIVDSRKVTPHPWPFCCFAPWRGGEFVYKSLTGVLQYVPCSILVMVTSLIGVATHVYHEGNFSATQPYLYCVLIMNFSQMYALYCLVLFYMATRHELREMRPLPKFLCIKGVVFFTWWQGLVISLMEKYGFILPKGDGKLGSTAQNFVICIEMFFFALAHAHAFPATEFAEHAHNPRSQVASLSSQWDDEWESRAAPRGSAGHGVPAGGHGRKKRGLNLPDLHLREFREGLNLFDILEMRRAMQHLGRSSRSSSRSRAGYDKSLALTMHDEPGAEMGDGDGGNGQVYAGRDIAVL